MATSQQLSTFLDYEGFVDKFEPKKTTDDCYTPTGVYEAIAEWVSREYKIDSSCFCRPFYPGGDYERYNYENKIVVDNPPFSILSKILAFYLDNKIKFFLFCPALVGVIRYSDFCTALAVGATITYQNGASVNTSFITNLEPHNIRIKTAPDLYEAISRANKVESKKKTKKLPKYAYPLELVTAAQIHSYNKHGIDFVINRDESVRITKLDAQRKEQSIYGGGLLISEREKAEREKAEREKAEREKAERFVLSARERYIVQRLSARGNDVNR